MGEGVLGGLEERMLIVVDERGLGVWTLGGLEERGLVDTGEEFIDEGELVVLIVLLNEVSGLVLGGVMREEDGDEGRPSPTGALSCTDPLNPMGTKAGDLESLKLSPFFFFLLGWYPCSQFVVLACVDNSLREKEVTLGLELLPLVLLVVKVLSCFVLILSDEMTMVASPTFDGEGCCIS